MGIFKTKNNGPVNFTSLVQTRQGTVFNRYSDLFGQFRANPITGKFEFLFPVDTSGLVVQANAGARKVTTSGPLAGGVFTNNFQRRIPYAVFDGTATKQSINHSDSGKTFFWVPYGSGNHIMHSGWINLRSLPAGSPGGRAIFEISDGNLYSSTVYINSNGQLGYRFHDLDTATITNFRGKLVPQEKRFKVDTWYHYVIVVENLGTTVDGSDANKFHFWINGTKVPDNLLVDEVGSASFAVASASSNGQDPATFGYGRGGYDNGETPGGNLQANAYLHAYLAEMCFWRSTTLFTDAEAESVYRAFSNISSGMTNPSERLLLRDRDQHSTHPTIARSSDRKRLGNHKIKFDDTRAQTLKTAAVQYPTKLVSGDSLLDTIYAGHNNGGLSVQTNASTDAFNTYYRRNDQPAHPPYTENEIYINSGSSFYQTGTLETILPGFDKPLHNKDVVQIVLDNKQQIKLGFGEYNAHSSTTRADGKAVLPYNTSGHAAVESDFPSASYMAYFDTTTSKFSPLGHVYIPIQDSAGTGSIAQTYQLSNSLGQPEDKYLHDWMEQHNLDTAAIGFFHKNMFVSCSADAPLNFLSSGTSENETAFQAVNFTCNAFEPEYYETSGMPTDYYGFPDDKRYHQSGSNSIKMSDYITEPFLVEKIVYEFPSINAQLRSSVQSYYFGPTNHPGGVGLVYNRSNTSDIYASSNIWFGYGHEMLTAFLMRQFPGKTSTEVQRKFYVFDHKIFAKSGFTATGNESRELINYGQAYFADIHDHSMGKYQESQNASRTGARAFQVASRLSNGTTANHYLEWADEKHLSDANVTGTGGPGTGKWINNTGHDRFWLLASASFPYETMEFYSPTHKYTGASAFNDMIIDQTLNDFDFVNMPVRIETTPKVLPKTDLVSYTDFHYPVPYASASNDTSQNNEHGSPIFQWNGGPANIANLNSTRHQGVVAAGKGAVSSVDLPVNYSSSPSSVLFDTSQTTQKQSTYILTPEDKLVFGVQSMPIHGGGRSHPRQLRINPGEIKITLFGSYIRNSKSKPPQLNQLLSNDIVHESIGAETVFDQFDVESRAAFTGSYVDEIMSGSTTGPLYSDHNGAVFEYPGGSSRRAEARITLTANMANQNTISITFGNGATPQVITMNSGAGTDATTFNENAANLFLDNNGTAALTASRIAVLANSVSGYTATSDDTATITIIADTAVATTRDLAVANSGGTAPTVTTFTGVSPNLQTQLLSANTNLARRVNGRASLGTQGVTGSLRRTLPIASADKTEFDSILFDIESMFKQDLKEQRPLTPAHNFQLGEERASAVAGAVFLFFGLANRDNKHPDPHAMGAKTIRGSFLMSKFNSITRVRKDQMIERNDIRIVLTGSEDFGTAHSAGAAGSGEGHSFAPFVVSNANAVGITGERFVSNFNGSSVLSADSKIIDDRSNRDFLARFIFGLGEGVGNAHLADEYPSGGASDTPANISQKLHDIRGFRYGLSNVADRKPRNIFRRDRYGQLRDMFEMAPNTAYLDDATNTISYPVEARFFDSEGAIAEPDQTSCSNLSTNVTSSAPFFDREVVEFTDPLIIRNRGPINNKVADVTIEL